MVLSNSEKCMYFIGWVAVQYHWILDESMLYLSECVRLAIQTRRVQCPVILDDYPFNEKFIAYHTHHP